MTGITVLSQVVSKSSRSLLGRLLRQAAFATCASNTAIRTGKLFDAMQQIRRGQREDKAELHGLHILVCALATEVFSLASALADSDVLRVPHTHRPGLQTWHHY